MQHNLYVSNINLHYTYVILYVTNYLTLALMCIIQIQFGKRSFFPWIGSIAIFGFDQHHFIKELSSKKWKTFNDMIQRSSNNSIWYSPREMGRYSRVSTGPKRSNNIGWTFMEFLNSLFNSGSVFLNFKQILTWFGTHIDVFSNHLWKKFLQARPRHYPLKLFSFRLCNPATKQIRLSNHFHVRV